MRTLFAGLWLSLLAAAPVVAQRAPANQRIELTRVGSVGFTVSDLDRSVAFFTEVLGFGLAGDAERLGEAEERLSGVFGTRVRVARLALGTDTLELSQYLAPEGRPLPIENRGNDRWFQHIAIVVSDMDRAYATLRAHKVRHASTGPQRLPDSNPNAGGIRAFYFKDPDGHFLEAIWFPVGKGDPKWQQGPGAPTFLGIDHTAIVVEDTEASLAVYRDLLGFTVAGQSRNFGAEQAHLNNVEGASLLITGLRLSAGPGVELLEYLSPRDGRPYPADARANDLVHWQTTLVARGEGAVGLAATSGLRLVSAGAVEIADRAVGFARGVVVRDPDGHALRVVQR